MNLKKAKKLRTRAKQLGCEFVKAKVLTPELTDGVECSKLINSLPYRTLLFSNTGHRLAAFTQKWWIKQVKKHPTKTYKEFEETVYGTAK